MNPPRPEPLEYLAVEDAPVTQVPPPLQTCKRGHVLTPENTYFKDSYPCCRTCKVALERARRAKAKREPISPGLAAWVARKRRERDGLELRRCDREQVGEQLEDMGGL